MLLSATATAMFPKAARLRKRVDYLRLASARHKTTVRGFLVVWSENNGEGSRLGITASRKVGCAVVRNRIKRHVREFFRHVRGDIRSVDVNVIARRDSAQMAGSDVVCELTKAFNSIGISSCSRALCSL